MDELVLFISEMNEIKSSKKRFRYNNIRKKLFPLAYSNIKAMLVLDLRVSSTDAFLCQIEKRNNSIVEISS